MKTKLSKVLGVGLALIMVFSLAVALAPTPVQAQEGEQQWNAQPLPLGPAGAGVYNVLLNGSDIGEIAVYADGMTMYAINTAVAMNAGAAAAPYALYKSIDGGQTWAPVTALATATDPTGAIPSVPLANVAIAPDNPNYVAVSIFGNQSAADVAFITRDGGATWTTLPAINATATASAQRIMDLKVGPAREPTIFGREYLVAVSDNRANSDVEGNLQIIGQLTTWQNVEALSVADFTSCEFSLLYAGDRIVMGVGTVQAGNTSVYAYNSQTLAGGGILPNSPTVLSLAATDNVLDYDGAGVNSILLSDLALPNDYDANSPGFDRLWASIATAQANNLGGVYRAERGVGSWELRQVAGGSEIRSIAYTGSCAAGTLYEGDYNGLTAIQTAVRFTDQAQVNLPIWYPSYKPPTGSTGVATAASNAYVRCSPTDGSTVYCVTSGAESAFNVSTDAGVTYNQEALIDNGAADTVVAIDAMTLSPDGATLFMITNDAVGGAGQMDLWKTATPPSPFSWVRIFCVTKNAGASVGTMAINMGGWADAPEIYFVDRNVAAGGLYASYDGGNVFLRKNFQVALGATGFLSVGGSKQLYHSVAASPLIYRSTTGGNSWLTPATDAGAGNVTSVIPAPNGDILVGGTAGLASISKDAGATFTALQPGLNPGGNYVVTADEGYADNNILYAFDFTATASGVYRINVAADGSWIALANPAGVALVGAGQNNGTLYAMTAGAGCDRTLYPHWDVGAMAATWGNMGAGALPAGVAPGTFAVAANKAYAARAGALGALSLWAYNDYFATHNATINTPADGANIGIDPVTGRADILELGWTTIGTGTGQATAYNVYIWEKPVGPGGASVFAALAFAGGGVSSPSIIISPGAGAVAPNINYNFIGGREYGIMLEAQNSVSADAVNSAMSVPIFISIEPSTGIISPTSAGPVLQSPQPGDQNVNPGASFSWAPMAGVTEYSFILAKDAALTDVVVSDTVSGTAYGPIDLEYDTDYYYAVQATAPTSSVQSIGAFHTSVEKYTCQYCGLTFDSREALEAHIAAVHAPTTPLYIWIVIAIGAILVIVVIWLIFNTRRA